MDDQVIVQILDLLHSLQEACPQLSACVEQGKTELFHRLSTDASTGLFQILRQIGGRETIGEKRLYPAVQSILDSLRRISGLFCTDSERCLRKIEFELLPLLQEAYASFYFFAYIAGHPEKLPDYYAREKQMLNGNFYIDEAVKANQYKYEVSIFVLAYNKLDYTKLCVESLLENIPNGLNYELILINHGSHDGTKEYFEQLRPHKQLDIAVNGGGSSAVGRIVEGEFSLQVSNDVIITPHAIENMLACMRSDPQIAWVVPSTPNVSNFQTISAQYSTPSELMRFARQNNKSDPFRWEQRVRLCNPIDLRRNSVFYGSEGLCLAGNYHSLHPTYAGSFPDDRTSLLLRRNGYRLFLAKDAYCHHFGSVTLKDEIRLQDEQKYYLEGRKEFFGAYHVDPWGTGFCYDHAFLERRVGTHGGPVCVLGINCGLGSNSLRIKEQIREYCHTDQVLLTNITDEPRFYPDLAGISDQAQTFSGLTQLKLFLRRKRFDYIVLEEDVRMDISGEKLLGLLWTAISPGGRLFVKSQARVQNILNEKKGWYSMGENWYFRLKSN